MRIQPEIIEKIRKREEDRQRPGLELPLYPPDPNPPFGEEMLREPEETTARVLIIDL